MSYPITQNLINGLPQKAYRNGVGAYEGVVNHATDNTAPAINERNYEANGAWQNAFVHFFVDWTSIIQVADTNYIAWGAGPVANSRYVHVELCQTNDPSQFQESYNRYVWLTAKLLKDRNLRVVDGGTLVSHDWVSKHLGGTTHSDPIAYLQSHGIGWTQHVSNVQAEYNCQTAKPAPVSPAPVVTEAKTGTVEVMTDNLNLRTSPSNSGSVIRQLGKGEQYSFYAIQDGWYDLGRGQWAFGKTGQYLKESDGRLGVIEIICDSLNLRKSADLNSPVVGTLHKGEKYIVWEQVNGMYNVGGWCSANPKYVKFSK